MLWTRTQPAQAGNQSLCRPCERLCQPPYKPRHQVARHAQKATEEPHNTGKKSITQPQKHPSQCPSPNQQAGSSAQNSGGAKAPVIGIIREQDHRQRGNHDKEEVPDKAKTDPHTPPRHGSRLLSSQKDKAQDAQKIVNQSQSKSHCPCIQEHGHKVPLGQEQIQPAHEREKGPRRPLTGRADREDAAIRSDVSSRGSS